MAVLREEGVHDPLMIYSACLEADGHISLIKKDEAEEDDQPKRR
jgi:uncharacterized membrane protein YcaP (DUF421 family)